MKTARTSQANAELALAEQTYGTNPLDDRETNHYRGEYVRSFVERWDELIDWNARAGSEGQFFIDVLRARNKHTVLDVACGTGFHSVGLTEAGFDVTSADGSASMLSQAFKNGLSRGLVLKTVQADWRWLNQHIQGKYDSIICLGNSFTHLFDEQDRRRTLAEFYAALKHDGVLILDQRNYDAIIDHGFSSKHKYYYCGDKVVAEPEHVDDGLCRMKYDFSDGASYTLNMYPLRKNYTRKLMLEAGFQRIRTYGDFQETYHDAEPDFFVHIAEKSALRETRWSSATHDDATDVREVTEDYYDSDDADTFYSEIWGGEDVHVGIYDKTDDIRQASATTVERMAAMLGDLDKSALVLDIGSGYGGSARHLARTVGCHVRCLNISETQNDTNRIKNRQQGLAELVSVVHGVFEALPESDGTYDVVWCQDAILHSDQRGQVLAEVFRVLKPGGEFIFTDPMQADDCPPDVLQPVYDRLSLTSLGSFRFYREAAIQAGFDVVDQVDLTGQLRTHYARVGEELRRRYDGLSGTVSRAYMDRMLAGLDNWVKAADAGHLAWGIQHFRKPS